MSKISKFFIMATLLVSLLLLSACTSSTPQAIEVTKIVNQTVEVEVTRIVEQTVVSTQIVTVVVTATPEPVTAMPTLQPTPEFQKWISEYPRLNHTSL